MRNTTKILCILFVSVIVGIGTPAAFSVSSGQHQFRQIDPNAPDEFCNKCHGNTDAIRAELDASGIGLYNGEIKIHSTQKCVNCHQLTSGYGSGVAGEKSEHAATIPTCEKCHDQDPAMGFNAYSEFASNTEAHKSLSGGNDMMCIGCHTQVAVTGSISYNYSGEKHIVSGITIGD